MVVKLTRRWSDGSRSPARDFQETRLSPFSARNTSPFSAKRLVGITGPLEALFPRVTEKGAEVRLNNGSSKSTARKR